ncbi:MAG: sortase domain-containing protein [Nocardioides sp.]
MRPRHLVTTVVAVVALTACAGDRGPTPSAAPRATGAGETPSQSRTPDVEPTRTPEGRPVYGQPAPARLTIPDLDLEFFAVAPYRGRTDDARGTDIQNRGSLASPHGPHGGTGPGGIGNYQVTGHRLSSTMPFRYLPRLTRGDTVHVESRGVRHVYRIVATRETSFRSARSLGEQRAAVPGRPTVDPTRAMLTLSTCATIEDHAEGNFWSDRFDNPEHRIDKIGVLVRSVPMSQR